MQVQHQTNQYIDCESALKSLRRELYKPGHMMDTDSDRIMSQHNLKSRSNHTII